VTSSKGVEEGRERREEGRDWTPNFYNMVAPLY